MKTSFFTERLSVAHLNSDFTDVIDARNVCVRHIKELYFLFKNGFDRAREFLQNKQGIKNILYILFIYFF